MTGEPPAARLSLGKLALFSMGAAALVLALATVLLNVLRPSPAVSLGIVALGIVGAITAMGVVSRRMVRSATSGDRGDNPDDGTN